MSGRQTRAKLTRRSIRIPARILIFYFSNLCHLKRKYWTPANSIFFWSINWSILSTQCYWKSLKQCQLLKSWLYFDVIFDITYVKYKNKINSSVFNGWKSEDAAAKKSFCVSLSLYKYTNYVSHMAWYYKRNLHVKNQRNDKKPAKSF